MTVIRRLLLLPVMAGALLAQFSSIDDQFTDGNSQNQDLANGSMRVFNGRANTVRTDAAGSVRFSQIGTSSEGFWVHFADRAVPLRIGDRLTVGATFSLEGFSKSSGQDLRFGIFDSKQTRTNANLTGGMNSPVFTDDTGYGGAFYASGAGAPFQLFRRTTLPGNNNPFLSFADFTELPGSGASARITLDNGVEYTWTMTVERVAATSTRLTVSMAGADLEGMMYTAVETSPDPAAMFDLFALRITSNAFASGFTFTRFFAQYTPAPPIITAQPSPTRLSVSAGSDVSLSVGAAGADLRYAWRRNGAPLEGRIEASLQLTKVRTEDSGRYDVVVSNDGGAVTSAPVALTVVTGPVGPGPVITQQPRDMRVVAGEGAILQVAASGPELEFQWFATVPCWLVREARSWQ